jgi:hypothetical protein
MRPTLRKGKVSGAEPVYFLIFWHIGYSFFQCGPYGRAMTLVKAIVVPEANIRKPLYLRWLNFSCRDLSEILP